MMKKGDKVLMFTPALFVRDVEIVDDPDSIGFVHVKFLEQNLSMKEDFVHKINLFTVDQKKELLQRMESQAYILDCVIKNFKASL